MVTHRGYTSDAAHADVLRRLVEAKGLARFAFFDVVGEGRRLPNGLEVQSGFVVDGSGVVHSFWTGWDDGAGEPTLTRWTRVAPEPDWLDDEEYRRALDAVGSAS